MAPVTARGTGTWSRPHNLIAGRLGGIEVEFQTIPQLPESGGLPLTRDGDALRRLGHIPMPLRVHLMNRKFRRTDWGTHMASLGTTHRLATYRSRGSAIRVVRLGRGNREMFGLSSPEPGKGDRRSEHRANTPERYTGCAAAG